jgi:hypothetical protein
MSVNKKLNSLEHTNIVKDLNHKKLLHVLHKQFRDIDQQKLKEEKRREDHLLYIPTSSTTTISRGLSLNRSQSTPEIRNVRTVIEEIKYHTKTERRRHLQMSQRNFSHVLDTAQRQISKLPFSPLRHNQEWHGTGKVHMSASEYSRGPRDISKQYVGEFTDQWFEKDKDGLKKFLSSPTKKRTYMTRQEFFEACVHSTTGADSTSSGESISSDKESKKKNPLWSDPSSDGRAQVYDMLVSSSSQNNYVIKRKAWKIMKSERDSRPILDACPQLTPLAGRPTPLWSSATAHDKALPPSSVICNMESRLPIKSMKGVYKRLKKDLALQNPIGLTLRQCALRQEALKATDFYEKEMKKLRRETPSVIRKEQEIIKQRRFAELAARKAKKLAKREEAKRLQEAKAAKQAKAMEILHSRPGTALADLSKEEKINEAAKILQRAGKGFLYRKRKNKNSKEKGAEEEV